MIDSSEKSNALPLGVYALQVHVRVMSLDERQRHVTLATGREDEYVAEAPAERRDAVVVLRHGEVQHVFSQKVVEIAERGMATW